VSTRPTTEQITRIPAKPISHVEIDKMTPNVPN